MANRTGMGVKTNIPVYRVPENYMGNSGIIRTGTEVILSIPVCRLAENPREKNKPSVPVQHYMCMPVCQAAAIIPKP